MGRASSRSKRTKEADQLEKVIALLEKIAANVQMLEFREAAKSGSRSLSKGRKKAGKLAVFMD
jgi:hypothetical protein